MLGGLGVATLITASLLWNNSTKDVTPQYVQKQGVLDNSPSASEYQKFIQSKMIDMETGEVIKAEKLNKIMKTYKTQPKSLAVDWVEMGPDNIGGRTRAVIVDNQNQDRIWSGGVTGGLYKSEHRANYWERVTNFPGNQMISSITQDPDGNVYVATGNSWEGGTWPGDGLYVTPDAGDSWELVEGTESFTRINQICGNKENNKIFIAANNNGLYEYEYNGNLEAVSSYPATVVQSMAVSEDGQLVVVADDNQRTIISKDGGQTWTNKFTEGQIQASGGRVEYAISKKKDNGQHSVYASFAVNFGNNAGQWISLNNGDTWHRHTPATPGSPIEDGIIDFRNQGNWNNIASFDPTDPKRVIIGGIDLHEWTQVIDNPPSGGWNKISVWFANPTSDIYVHADQHDLFWDENDVLFVGNDGGIQISEDYGSTFYEANRGYNIAQFFKISYSREGEVLGGTQDNGALYNNLSNTTYTEFKRATGGDGFATAISWFNRRVLFTSSQFNNVRRSSDGGQIFNAMPLPFSEVGVEGGIHPFHTMFVFNEYYDENSKDSVTFIPQDDFSIGEVVKVPSLATGDTIDYITPEKIFFSDTLVYFPDSTRTEYIVTDQIAGLEWDLGLTDFTPFPTASGNYPPEEGDSLLVDGPLGEDTIIVDSIIPYDFFVGVNQNTGQTYDMHTDTVTFNIPWDTIRVQDPYQSWFVISTRANGGEIWGTRDAARFSISEPKWVRLAQGLNGPAVDMEFNEDLSHLFICGGANISSTSHNAFGGIYRLDGLGSVYSTEEDFEEKCDIDEGATAVNFTTIASNGFVGIGIDPRNPDDLVATQGFNGNVHRSSNATSASPSLTQVGSQGGIAFYDVIIDRDDNNILFAATHNGASLSEDGGATWSDVSHPSFFGTPSYHILQSWRTWNEGNKKPGAVFLGTHGRGIFRTDAILNVVENDEKPEKKKNKSNLEVYPNPAMYNSTLVVDIEKENDVQILFFNLSGSVVKQLNRPNMHVGKNEVFFSASDLPQGTYIIRVQAGQQIETIKYIKL